MTVKELIELLTELPEEAIVMISHDLIGDKHELVDVQGPDGDNIVWLHEIYSYY